MTILENEGNGPMKNALEFIKGSDAGLFKPVAYYDDRLDCVRVITSDCSVSEIRINQYLTIAEDAHPIDQAHKYVGFTIKGIRHFMQSQKKENPNSLELTTLLDQVLAELPKYVDDVKAKQIVEFAVNISLGILSKVDDKTVPLRKAA